jgi:hypothetical protein
MTKQNKSEFGGFMTVTIVRSHQINWLLALPDGPQKGYLLNAVIQCSDNIEDQTPAAPVECICCRRGIPAADACETNVVVATPDDPKSETTPGVFFPICKRCAGQGDKTIFDAFKKRCPSFQTLTLLNGGRA